MWFGKILNPERLKKIKGNRETFGFKADMLIIYNFFLTTSLSVYSELLTAFQDQCSLKLCPFPTGFVSGSGCGTSKYATCCQEHTKMRTKQGTYFVSLLYANQILTQK